MKQRIYWLLPDLASAERAMTDLLDAGMQTRRIHFSGRDGLDMTGLHAASVLQTSDVLAAAQRGLALGAITGTGAGVLAAFYFLGPGDGPQWEIAVLLVLLGGIVGAWSSSMIGISIPSPRLERFQGAIDQGRILLMIDVDPSHSQAVASLLQAAHPEAQFEGAEGFAPAMPSS